MATNHDQSGMGAARCRQVRLGRWLRLAGAPNGQGCLQPNYRVPLQTALRHGQERRRARFSVASCGTPTPRSMSRSRKQILVVRRHKPSVWKSGSSVALELGSGADAHTASTGFLGSDLPNCMRASWLHACLRSDHTLPVNVRVSGGKSSCVEAKRLSLHCRVE